MMITLALGEFINFYLLYFFEITVVVEALSTRDKFSIVRVTNAEGIWRLLIERLWVRVRSH